MNYDEIRSLQWHELKAERMRVWIAPVPVGQYMVKQFGDTFRWDRSFYNEGRSTECESVEAGMQAAWEHWKNLVRQIIEPHPVDGTIVKAMPETPPPSTQR